MTTPNSQQTKDEAATKKEGGTKKNVQTKEKLQSIMEAASALTSLNEEGGSNPGSPRSGSPPPKRYIPEHKKPDAALTFPEKLMFMMNYAEKAENKETYCVAWLADGKSFVVRDANEFTKQILPKFFKATKFSSFTRKLYRWGFRQVNRGIGPDDPIIFGNEHFQRDRAEMMVKMRSTTAAGTRKQNEVRGKRGIDDDVSEEQRKRMIMGWGGGKDPSSMGGMPGGPQGYGAPFNLASALRPSLGMQAMNPIFFQQQQQAAQMEQQKRLSFLQNMQQGPPSMQQMQGGQPNPAMFLPAQGMGMGPMGMGMGMGGMGMPNQFPGMNQGNSAPGLNSQHNGSSQSSGVADQPQQPPQAPPQQQQPPQQPPMSSSSGSGPNGQFPGAASTAEIVNAAINALRYAN
eukprot:CAMPEP_0194032892 /NCGR_PEP_ID=MMETSP0009_2-20130614/5739_1 /TAXON_ID=210454 /ORGANISM="Grammatophora oceanica, Strain CCMP 410" /LENGTH=401 /DNA_ID=CAMNT_0038673465 /DNA_START=30 /DNA_END=1235 /DNA_ORIENTATION=+